MPLPPINSGIFSDFPSEAEISSEEGRAKLREACEARLSGADGVWKMRLLARDLVTFLGPAAERTLARAGMDARLRRVETLRITRGVREYGACNIPRANDRVCRLSFSGHLFFPGNSAALIDVIVHEILHAVLPAKEGHGALFHRGMALLNSAWGLNIRVYSEKSAIRQSEALYKYKVVCANCGNAFYYLRAGAVVRRPRSYLCSKCGKSALEVYELIREPKN